MDQGQKLARPETEPDRAPDFRKLFDAIPGLYLVLHPNSPTFSIAAVNAAYTQATLTEGSKILGRPLFEVFPDNPNDPSASGVRNLKASLERVLATKAAETMAVQKYDIRRPESEGGGFEERYWSPVNSPLLDDFGRVEFIVHRVEDVTDLVRLRQVEKESGQLKDDLRARAGRAEAELTMRGRQLAEYQGIHEQTERKLAASEARFAMAFAEAPVGMVLATPEGRVLEANQAFLNLLGVERNQLVGHDSVFFTHPDDMVTTPGFDSSLFGDSPSAATFEKRHVRSDGEVLWVRISATMRRDDEGNAMQLIGIVEDITERKLAQTRLERQWQNFDAALSHIPDFTYIFDLEGRFTYINRALLSLLQKSFAEVRGKNFFELDYPPELAAKLQRQIQEVITTRNPVRDQTPFTGPDGNSGYYEYIFAPVFDKNGGVEAVVGTTRDITEQNVAAQQIEEDRRRWRDLLLQTPAAIAVMRGPDHTFEWANPEFLRLLGKPSGSVIGRTVMDAVPEVAGQPYINLLDGVLKTGEPFEGHEMPLRLLTNSGERKEIYVNFVYLPTTNSAGVIDGVFCHATDVTEMVVARKQIEESEAQFRILAETIPHLAWMAEEKGAIFWYNRRWYEFTGTRFEDMKGWGWQSVHDPAVLPEVLRQWEQAIADGAPFEMIFPLRGVDGAFRSFLTRVEPVKDSAGNVVRWFGTNTDITQQQLTEDALRRTNRELEEFAFVASHDLQEPLRMVNIYTELILREQREPNETIAQYADFVRRGVTRMDALIHDLLSFSKTVHSEAPANQRADLAQALEQALAMLAGRIEETKTEIHVEGLLPVVRGDTSQLMHVFQNIISNSMKYCKENVPPVIRIAVTRAADRWTIAVEDNGIGFDQKYASRIFGLFKRLHKDEYKGTGLGLAICKRIVEGYGGTIGAEGRLGVGATFHLSLPVLEVRP